MTTSTSTFPLTRAAFARRGYCGAGCVIAAAINSPGVLRVGSEFWFEGSWTFPISFSRRPGPNGFDQPKRCVTMSTDTSDDVIKIIRFIDTRKLDTQPSPIVNPRYSA